MSNVSSFPGRIEARRKGALARREINLKNWKATQPTEDITKEEIEKKISIAETDIANLRKSLRISA